MRDRNVRDFPGRIALIALLRIGHVAGVVGLGSAVLNGLPVAPSFAALLVCSGAGIAALDAWSNRAWRRQVAGLTVLLKAGTLALLAVASALGPASFWTFLVVSVAIAHAPGRVRHARLF